MNEETFNKHFGVTAQREIERAVGAARGSGRLRGDESLRTRAVLTVEGLGTLATIDGEIHLE